MTFILTIDQGTTSSRAIIFDQQGRLVGSSQREFEQFFPKDGWVEHCPTEILNSTLDVIRAAISQSNLNLTDLTAIGITNQRETVVVWDRATGEPIYPAIVWQDRRTADRCKQLREEQVEAEVNARTGLLLDPYFSATKIAWILDNVDGARGRAISGELAAGTIDSWLVWHLTRGCSHVTDATNASRTSLFNIHTNRWDDTLCDLFNVPANLLPEVRDSAGHFGDATSEPFNGLAVPITGIAGDQQAALIGQCALSEGAIKSTYGTGCFVIANTGAEPLASKHRLLTTIAYRINGETTYGLEGSIFIAGAAVQWLRDELEIITDATQTQAILEKTEHNHGITVVPAFTGLGAPHWCADARGAIFGLKRNSGRNELITATLESVALQSNDLLEAFRDDGLCVSQFKIDGGMSTNPAFCQLLADITNQTVFVPRNSETTALGAAFLAAVGVGLYKTLDDVSEYWELDSQYEPQTLNDLEQIKKRWTRCVELTKQL